LFLSNLPGFKTKPGKNTISCHTIETHQIISEDLKMKLKTLEWVQLIFAVWLLNHTTTWAQTRGLPSSDQVVLSVGGRVNIQTATLDSNLHSRVNPQLSHGRLNFDLQTLERLPQHQFTTMTPWSDKPIHFSGPLLRDVLKVTGAQGVSIRATAINDYRINIPVDDALRFDMIVATRMNGERMSVRDKGPLFVVYPFDSQPSLQHARYYERSIWQLKSLDLD
jgi:hypothetical protein